MSTRVTIIDYGLGNLHSVANALRAAGLDPVIAVDGAGLGGAERLVLPGVGAFADGMRGLRERGHDVGIDGCLASGARLLGICLGAQLLFSESEEFGLHQGLGILPGRVVPVPANGQKVPHVGWKRLELTAAGRARAHAVDSSWAYFIHSFHIVPDDPAAVLATAPFGPDHVTAMVGGGRVVGCQFHPEKSGPPGIELLAKFFQT